MSEESFFVPPTFRLKKAARIGTKNYPETSDGIEQIARSQVKNPSPATSFMTALIRFRVFTPGSTFKSMRFIA